MNGWRRSHLSRRGTDLLWRVECEGNNPLSWGWCQRIWNNNPTDERAPMLNPTQKEEDDARPENAADPEWVSL